MKEKIKLGRPDKFTPERRAAIIDAIAHAIPNQLAAEANGICEDTLYHWINRGKEDLANGIDSEYASFSELFKDTEMKRMRSHLDKIEANGDRWQADAWTLERRWWKHFSPSAAVVDFNKRLERMEKDHGRQAEQVDSESNKSKAQRSIAQGTACADGQEDSESEIK